MDKLGIVKELRRLALILEQGAETLPKRTPEVLREGAKLIEESLRKKKPIEISDLGLSAHAYNALYRYGWRHIEDLARKSERTLMRIPGVGPGTAREIREAVERYEKENGETQ